ncbi:MAG TPA: sugar transferase [Gemmatimonadales bacterium]|nr:sugar transferase [Gemmatimonadales bacterium]
MDGKRAGDFLLSGVLLLLFLPLLVLCGLAVWASDGRPVLFGQERVGLDGRSFRIVKFRTMRMSAGPLVTAAGDRRVTPLGAMLRRWKLDELPQLWNVLLGEMSFVGPRPEVPYYVERNARWFRGIRRLRPGITDWSSLIFRDEERLLAAHAGEPAFYERTLLPRKVALARLYARHQSWQLDLGLLAATALILGGATAPGYRLIGRALVQRARAGLEPAGQETP